MGSGDSGSRTCLGKGIGDHISVSFMNNIDKSFGNRLIDTVISDVQVSAIGLEIASVKYSYTIESVIVMNGRLELKSKLLHHVFQPANCLQGYGCGNHLCFYGGLCNEGFFAQFLSV
jgi:hypothetical protein